jgi:hypothetical protein
MSASMPTGMATGSGSRAPVRARTRPATTPSTGGDVTGERIARIPGPLRPVVRSSSAKLTGTMTSSWSMSAGTTGAAVPATSTRMGRPRLPAFT